MIVFGLVLPRVSAANIVLNPGFETGDLTSWVSNPRPGSHWGVFPSDPPPHSGTYSAQTGCVGAPCMTPDDSSLAPVGSWLFQDLPTAPGTFYNLSFWYTPGPGTVTGTEQKELQVLWNGAPVYTNTDSSNTNTYTQITLQNLPGSLTSATTRLEFLGRQDPDFDGVDDVSVEATNVPEPGTLALFAVGLSGLWRGRRRIAV